jgi:hypothetical protein
MQTICATLSCSRTDCLHLDELGVHGFSPLPTLLKSTKITILGHFYCGNGRGSQGQYRQMGMSRFFGSQRLFPMKKTAKHLTAEVPSRPSRVEMTIGIDLGDVWSHYFTLNEDGEVVDRGRFRTIPKAVEKWFTDLPPTRVAMEAGVHSIWISEQLQELGHEVIVANVRELRAISHSDRKSDQVDAEKLARYARLDPNILRPIAHRTVAQKEALTMCLEDILRLFQASGEF